MRSDTPLACNSSDNRGSGKPSNPMIFVGMPHQVKSPRRLADLPPPVFDEGMRTLEPVFVRPEPTTACSPWMTKTVRKVAFFPG
jgi:hypothetical protein